jgi:16S rRNA processing protein RimM
MEKSETFHLGYIAKLHGFKGEVSLFLDVTDPSQYKNMDMVFIEIDGQLVPHFISFLKLKNKGFAAVKFEGVDSEEQARKLNRKNVYLPAAMLPELKGNEFYDHEVVGFTVIDKDFGKVGKLSAVIDNAVNPLLQVFHENTEVLIPLGKDTVQKVIRKQKELHIVSPPGLIAMYME